MATTLKNYLTANVGVTSTTVYNPTTAGIQSTVIGFLLTNTTAANVTTSITLISGATTVYLVKNLNLVTSNTFDLLGGSKLILEQNDELKVISSAASSIDVTLSVVEVV